MLLRLIEEKCRFGERLYKDFDFCNQMKKRGIRPSSRTYAIMLNNYPSSFDAPAKTLSKATLNFLHRFESGLTSLKALKSL
jgi:hypothetical protein